MDTASTSPEQGAGYRFGAVRLDPAARRLEVDGLPRHLEPKAFDLLCLLVEERHRALTKDELLDRIWPGRVVVEGVLKRSVGLVRQALGDDAAEPRFLRTVHGVGYQFIAEVERLRVEPAPAAATRPRRPWALGLAAAAVIAVLTVVGFANLWSEAGSTDAGAVRALILPFENASGEAQLDWIEQGLPGLVVHTLIEEPGLSLISGEVAQRMAADQGVGFGSAPSELDAARALVAADYLVVGQLVGSVDAWGLQLRIVDAEGSERARRLDAAELAQLATDAGYRELRAAMLGAGAGVVTRSLSFDPFVNETYARAAAAREAGDSATARDLLAVVMRAAPEDLHVRMDLAEVEYRLGERAGLASLLDSVEQAVAADPHSALAQRLAQFRGNAAEAAGERDEAWARFEEMREIATLRGDRIAEADALRLLGRLAAQGDDLDAAEALMGRALAQFDQLGYEPGRATTLGNLGLVYWRRGAAQESQRRYEAALAAFERLGRRDSAASMRGNLGNILYELGDSQGALARYGEALAVQRELGNRASEVHLLGNIARMQSILGRVEEATETSTEMLRAADALGDAKAAANARVHLAEQADKAGRVDDSVRWYGEAAERYAQLGASDSLQVMRSKQVWVLADVGRAEAARALYEEHREAIEVETSPYMRSQAIGAVAALALAEGQLDSAIEALAAGRELTLAAGLTSHTQWFTGQLALNLLRAGRIEDAEAWIGLLDDLGGSVADAFLVRARHAYERGDYAAAVAHKERMREIADGNWTEQHAMQLATYREAAEVGRRLPLGDEL